VYVQVNPYLNKGLNEFQRIILISQFFTIFGGMMFIMIGCLDKMLEYDENAASRTDRDIVAVLILGINALAAFLFPVYRAYLAVSNSKMRFSTLCTSGFKKTWAMCCGCFEDKTKEHAKAIKFDSMLTAASTLRSTSNSSRSLMLAGKTSGDKRNTLRTSTTCSQCNGAGCNLCVQSVMEQQPGLAAGVKDYVSRRTPRSSSDNDFSGITTDMPTIIATNAPPSTGILRQESAGAKENATNLPMAALVHLHTSESMQEEVIPKPVATNADLTSIDLEGMDDEVKETHENADAQV